MLKNIPLKKSGLILSPYILNIKKWNPLREGFIFRIKSYTGKRLYKAIVHYDVADYQIGSLSELLCIL